MFDIKALEAEERRHQRISGIITIILVVLLLLLSLLWKGWRSELPAPGEEYEMIGAIDFGDLTEGSRQVNNFEEAIPDPAPPSAPSQPEPQPVQQQPQPAAQPTPAPKPAETTPEPDPIITTPEPTPVKQPEPPKEEKKPDPKPPKPEETVQPKPDPKPTTNSTETQQTDSKPTETKPTESSSSSSSSETTDKPSDKPSGSNQGNKESGTGNQGTPNIKKLDPNGLYSFGSGIGGGANGRSPISLPYPSYTVQEEGDVVFEFIIMPNGTVSFAKVKGVNSKPGLGKVGTDAIKKWRFSKLPSNVAQKPQRVTVTIKFRLKG